MDPKEIKLSLKNAQEAIKNKDFKTALQLCKAVLKSDRNNYIGLVLFGVALQDSEQKDQAPKAFRKAIEVSPKQTLAWQGLASFCEKEDSESHQEELLPIYQQLLSLESDEAKFLKVCNKLALVALKQSKIEQCVDILMTELKHNSLEKQKVIWRTLASVLMQQKDLSSELAAVLETSLGIVIKEPIFEDIEEYYKKYLRLLYKSKKFTLLLEEARKMHLLYPESVSALEWICKVYSEQIAQGVRVLDVSENSIKEYYKKLEVLSSGSGMVLLVKGAVFFRNESFVEARDALTQVIDALSDTSYVWIMLCQCHLQIHCYGDAEHCAREAMKIIQKQSVDENIKDLLLSILVKSLSLQDEEEKLKEAVDRCNKILSINPANLDILECLTRAHIMLGNEDEAEKCLQAVRSENKSTTAVALLSALFMKKRNKLKEAVDHLNAAVLQNPNSAELWLELGKLHCNEERYSLSLEALLKATKLGPHVCSCYLYLGHYYSLSAKDLDKARRCYQKAFCLNQNCKEAGAALSDIYRLQNNPRSNIELLTYVTQTAGFAEAKWAWLRLGLHHTEQGNHQEAIDSLLSAIRIDPTDRHCWESLADAYYGRGAYTAALKSYQRVLESDPDALYPAFQVGTIKQIVGSHEDSIEEFKILLSNNPSYVPALKGLGESCLCRARNSFSQQLLGCCRDSCQDAVDALSKAVEERKDLSCLWKLLGNACTLVAQLPDSYSHLCIRRWLTNFSLECEEGNECLDLDKGDVFQQGVRCYCRALSLCPNNSLLWHDLANVYHLQASFVKPSTMKKELRECALAAVKKSILLNPRNWQHWNLLGVIASSVELNSLDLAQHAFIKSIQLENNNAITWTNLGTLYLCLNEIHLAHEAFKVAQRSEPSYIESWIGQALVAESMNHEDAMDLFRHTTQLGIHLESCIGYSHWVCSTLKTCRNHSDPHYIYSIEKMDAIPVAGNAMGWYTGHVNKSACAYNMLGLLLERQQLYRGAEKAFEAAQRLLETAEDSTLSDMLYSNRGRVLVQLQQYEKAVCLYQQVKKPDFSTQCGLSVAYFKAEQYKDSYAAYETALEWLAPTDGEKSHVLVAMAAVAYKCREVEDCKTLLFQCVKLNPPSVQGLFAFCSLGMLHSDITLTELALRELMLHKDSPEYASHIANFKAYTHFLQGHSSEAVRALSSMVHRHPGDPSLWLALALLLLHLYSECKPKGAAHCAKVAMALGRSTMDVSKVMSLVSLSHLLSSNAVDSLRSSQKAVHLFPDIPENWVVLIAACMSRCIQASSEKFLEALWLKRLISHVRRKLDATRQMSQWLSHNERKVTIIAEECRKL